MLYQPVPGDRFVGKPARKNQLNEGFEQARVKPSGTTQKPESYCSSTICLIYPSNKGCAIKAPSTLRRRNLKTGVSLWKRIKCFPSAPRRRNLKTQQPLVISNLSWWKTRFRKVPISKCFPSTRKRKAGDFKFLRLKSVLEKLRFRDGLVWTVGLNVEINNAFKFLRRSVDAA